jgi:hypothetical protein
VGEVVVGVGVGVAPGIPVGVGVSVAEGTAVGVEVGLPPPPIGVGVGVGVVPGALIVAVRVTLAILVDPEYASSLICHWPGLMVEAKVNGTQESCPSSSHSSRRLNGPLLADW